MALRKKSAKPKANGSKKVVVNKKLPVVKDSLTKGGTIRAITDMTGVVKKDVTATLDALAKIIELHVKSRGPGKFVLPGLLKIVVVKKPARPARKGVNPFTGDEMMFKAKPAYKVVKVRALKKLKEMVD